MKKICGYCDKEYETKSKKSKYCSHKCYSLDKKQIKNRECNYCGIKYNPCSLRDNQKFCSISCYRKDKKEKSKRIFICLFCKKEYIFYGVRGLNLYRKYKRNYCSKHCADNARIGKYCGKNSSQRKGGVTDLQDLIRKSSNYIKIRTQCFIRDNYKSVLSGVGRRLNHHHLTSISIIILENDINKDNWRNKTDLLFDINNVVTLGEEEHKMFHGLYGKITTKGQFNEFKNNYLRGQYDT